ncbi:sensor histidine kinase [Paenibacillus contaminans]|uniref:histidine kinase n=1 Tax=Paenibacillus contaminans TaxID=450362 RepID=A0A329MN74_9BACL|nr:HAMP domain-containing sensor histidine kinase [Paenibacillus contaminans]RAV20746.1 sensor histidine kinase [Paenibacillus contaminans]
MDIKLKKIKSIRKIPVDWMIFIAIAILAVLFWTQRRFYVNLGLSWFFIYFFQRFLPVLMALLLTVKVFLRNNQFNGKRSAVTYYFSRWKDHVKTVLQAPTISLALIGIFFLTVLFGLVVSSAFFYPSRIELAWLTIYMLLYIMLVVPFVLSKLRRFTVIMNATMEIANGHVESTIHDTGRDVLSKLAEYINNMKKGYQNALENQIKSERLKTELITNVSHDLKTPLTSIINYVDLLKKEELPSETAKSHLQILERKAQRLKILIEDLFEVSKMTSGAVELNTEHLDVATLLTQAIAESKHHASNDAIEIRERIAKSPIYANLDGNKIWRVFENVIGNAMKYSLPGTRIYIYLDDLDHQVRLKIQNTAAYELDFAAEELFERFKRADVSRQTEGTGLGLTIVKSIVELHGGEINIEVDGDQFNVIVHLPKYRLK